MVEGAGTAGGAAPAPSAVPAAAAGASKMAIIAVVVAAVVVVAVVGVYFLVLKDQTPKLDESKLEGTWSAIESTVVVTMGTVEVMNETMDMTDEDVSFTITSDNTISAPDDSGMTGEFTVTESGANAWTITGDVEIDMMGQTLTFVEGSISLDGDTMTIYYVFEGDVMSQTYRMETTMTCQRA
jgi:heme/copper-type cytochrome/quinol oxidase subunit 4